MTELEDMTKDQLIKEIKRRGTSIAAIGNICISKVTNILGWANLIKFDFEKKEMTEKDLKYLNCIEESCAEIKECLRERIYELRNRSGKEC